MWENYKNIEIKATDLPLFQFFAMQILNENIQLTSPVNINSITINVNPGHGFIIGEYIILYTCNYFEQLQIINVVNNILTVAHPISYYFDTNSKIIRGNINLNIDASTNNVEATFKIFNCIKEIYIKKIIFCMQHGTNVPDDGKFGGIASLSKGLLIRKIDENIKNFGNYKINQDFKDRGAAIEYSQKAPAGTYATTITFDLNTIFGNLIKIKPINNEYIVAKLQDNFSTLNRFVISLIGYYKENL